MRRTTFWIFSTYAPISFLSRTFNVALSLYLTYPSRTHRALKPRTNGLRIFFSHLSYFFFPVVPTVIIVHPYRAHVCTTLSYPLSDAIELALS